MRGTEVKLGALWRISLLRTRKIETLHDGKYCTSG